MEKQRQNSYARATKQVEEMRRLYSRIGQPLPVDIIIDLHRHLAAALEINQNTGPKPREKNHRIRA